MLACRAWPIQLMIRGRIMSNPMRPRANSRCIQRIRRRKRRTVSWVSPVYAWCSSAQLRCWIAGALAYERNGI